MSEKEIRLDQTKKVFDTLATLIKNNETCTYRYLIYDLLGFEQKDYEPLMGGLAITNTLVELEDLKQANKDLIEYNDRLLKELLVCKIKEIDSLSKKDVDKWFQGNKGE